MKSLGATVFGVTLATSGRELWRWHWMPMNVFCGLFLKLSYMVMRWNFIRECFFLLFQCGKCFCLCEQSLFGQNIHQLDTQGVCSITSNGQIGKYLPAQGNWVTYAERLSYCFEANNITDANRKKGRASLSVWNRNILLMKRPHHIQWLIRQNTWWSLEEHCQMVELLYVSTTTKPNHLRLPWRWKVLKKMFTTAACFNTTAHTEPNICCVDWGNSSRGKSEKPCFRCDGKHLQDYCCFRNPTCNFCQKTGSILAACLKRKGTKGTRNRQTHKVDRDEHDDDTHSITSGDTASVHKLFRISWKKNWPSNGIDRYQ